MVIYLKDKKTKKHRILLVFGTRPELIKMAPVVEELDKMNNSFKRIVVSTGQHREMLQQMLSLFKIRVSINLNLMEENQSLETLTSKTMLAFSKVLKQQKPDLVLVQGDTTTAMIASLASFYQRIPVGHVEAGLRTHDIYNPFPEEINRRIISSISTFNFAPTKRAFQTLLNEGIPEKSIFLTGNTVIDALHTVVKKGIASSLSFKIPKKNRLILVTAHRRENFGRPLENICRALSLIAKKNSNVDIVYPVHLNPNVSDTVNRILRGQRGIHLIRPVEYHELICLMKSADIILTDSGGIQEEAPTFGKPVLVMRKETERPEGLEAGVAKLVGTETRLIVKEVQKLLCDSKAYEKMSKAVSPYGDGKAAKRIVSILQKKLR